MHTLVIDGAGNLQLDSMIRERIKKMESQSLPDGCVADIDRKRTVLVLKDILAQLERAWH